MHLSKIPLSSHESAKLKALFTSDGYALLERVIRAEYDAESVEAAQIGIEFLTDPANHVPLTNKLFRAAKLKAAMEVLAEFSDSDKDAFTIHIDP